MSDTFIGQTNKNETEVWMSKCSEKWMSQKPTDNHLYKDEEFVFNQ